MTPPKLLRKGVIAIELMIFNLNTNDLFDDALNTSSMRWRARPLDLS
jgi:hypothetical protein